MQASLWIFPGTRGEGSYCNAVMEYYCGIIFQYKYIGIIYNPGIQKTSVFLSNFQLAIHMHHSSGERSCFSYEYFLLHQYRTCTFLRCLSVQGTAENKICQSEIIFYFYILYLFFTQRNIINNFNLNSLYLI